MKRIASWNSSKFLTYSSLLFTLPAGYGYLYYNLYFSPLMLMTTSAVSVNYWRDAVDDWRRTLDLYFAKISFSYFVASAVIICPWRYSVFIGLPNLYAIQYCYKKSEELHKYKKYNKSWVLYHLGFHCLMTFQLFTLIRYIGKNNLQLKLNKWILCLLN
mgnify:CR=1 FL=1